MITYDIKTWRCSCGYAQDFEPTAEAMHLHFNQDKSFPLGDVRAGECPSCALKGERGAALPKETDPAKKSKHNHLEASDIPAKIAEAEAETRKVKTGRKLYVKAKDAADPSALEQVDEERDETPEEKTERVAKLQAKLIPADTVKIAEMRALYEDK